MGVRDRPTADLVVIFFAAMIGFVMLIGVLGLVVLKIARPDEDINSSVRVIGDLLTVALGAVIGFVGGKAVGAANGTSTTPTALPPDNIPGGE
jgi:hypothetical protein